MKKHTILRHHDKQAGIYYNLKGERFIPFTKGLMNALETETPVVEYDTARRTIVTITDEIAPNELVEMEVECFIITNAFNNIEEAVAYATA